MADDKKEMSGKSSPDAGGKPESKSVKSSKNSQESLQIRFTKWFKAKKNEYWSEFKRIVWPARDVLIKQTITVIVISLMFGAYIAILDGAFGGLYSMFANYTGTLFGS